MIDPTIEARIGGNGISSDRLVAHEPDARVKMVDEYLANYDRPLRGPLMYVEVKRDDPRSWDEWKEDVSSIEFIRVGIAGDFAAAEYVRGGMKDGKLFFRPSLVTFNSSPSPDSPRVVYDPELSWFFPPETVIPLEQVRRLMIGFVLTGEWPDEVVGRELDLTSMDLRVA